MRTATYGVMPDGARQVDAAISLAIWERMCRVRSFEEGVKQAVKDGFVTAPVYLSIGQEAIAAAMSLAIPEFMIFAQHRCHATYLCWGGDPVGLRDELLGLSTGTSGGRAGSNCVQCHDNGVSMFGHHGLIGENVPLAVGAALGSGRDTVCFFGDGAAEEDYVLSAMGVAATHKLPVLFVCEDNNLSILTPVSVRRSWNLTDVANALGIKGMELSDDPWTIYTRTLEIRDNLPAFVNGHTCRGNWHVGVGDDGPPEWDRFSIVRDEMKAAGLGAEAERIEEDAKIRMSSVWDREVLQRLSRK
ncbi:MAG: thiamine pyrophosphate-dependent enzyme [Thermodesulfobacteriota bacterium]